MCYIREILEQGTLPRLREFIVLPEHPANHLRTNMNQCTSELVEQCESKPVRQSPSERKDQPTQKTDWFLLPGGGLPVYT